MMHCGTGMAGGYPGGGGGGGGGFEPITDIGMYKRVIQGDCLIKFEADYCGSCKFVKPELDQLASDMAGQLKFYTLDIKVVPEARPEPLKGLPTFFCFKNGEKVFDKCTTDIPEEIIAHLKKIFGSGSGGVGGGGSMLAPGGGGAMPGAMIAPGGGGSYAGTMTPQRSRSNSVGTGMMPQAAVMAQTQPIATAAGMMCGSAAAGGSYAMQPPRQYAAAPVMQQPVTVNYRMPVPQPAVHSRPVIYPGMGTYTRHSVMAPAPQITYPTHGSAPMVMAPAMPAYQTTGTARLGTYTLPATGYASASTGYAGASMMGGGHAMGGMLPGAGLPTAASLGLPAGAVVTSVNYKQEGA